MTKKLKSKSTKRHLDRVGTAKAQGASNPAKEENRTDAKYSLKPAAWKVRDLPSALAPLIAVDQWIVWRWALKNEKWSKEPYRARSPDYKASTTEPKSWATFAEALAVVAAGRADGIGFVLTDCEFAAFDIDDCRDPATGVIHHWAQDLVDRAGSYCEVTISGEGLRIIGRADGAEIPKGRRKFPTEDGVSCEIYRRTKGRYIVMTGDQFGATEIINIDKVIDEVVAEAKPEEKKSKPQSPAPQRKTNKAPLDKVPQELRLMLYAQGDRPAGYPSRSELFWSFINTALRRGIDVNEIVDLTLDDLYAGCSIFAHVADNDGADYVMGQIERALNDGDDAKPTAGGKQPGKQAEGRTIIRYVEGKLSEIWRQTERALIKRHLPIFARGGVLVQPLWRWEKNEVDDRQVLNATLIPLNVTRLADITSHHAVQFQKYDVRNKQWKDCEPPDRVMEALLETQHPSFKTVKGIITSPTMRRDGSLITEPGYDAATQLWYKASSDIELPPIPEKPTKTDAEKALRLLNGLLAGFPFDGETDKKKHSVARSVALAAIMTTVLRGAFAAAPIFAVVAPVSRTGKTYLVQLISVLATGHKPVAIAGSARREEMEKRIETAALSGRTVLSLNNLPNGMVLESEALSQLSTEGTLMIRILGRHEPAVRLPRHDNLRQRK